MHRKPKLSVNIEFDWYHCWTCKDGKTRGKTLLGLFAGRISGSEISEYLDSLSDRPKIIKKQVDLRKPELPNEFESFSILKKDDISNASFLNYLKTRGVDDNTAAFYRLGICKNGKFKNRIVIPSFDEYGYLNFFSARKIHKEDFGMSYMTCDTSKDIIFNDCLVDWSLPLKIVEGPFDMLTAGRNCIPLQGKILRPGTKLFDKIVRSGIKVYVALDTDAKTDAIAIAHTLYRYCVDVSIVNCDGFKDVNDMGRKEFLHKLSSATKYDPKNKIRMLCE